MIRLTYINGSNELLVSSFVSCHFHLKFCVMNKNKVELLKYDENVYDENEG